eukprot:12927158-Prorocentrum_lima.AAC.1
MAVPVLSGCRSGCSGERHAGVREWWAGGVVWIDWGRFRGQMMVAGATLTRGACMYLPTWVVGHWRGLRGIQNQES